MDLKNVLFCHAKIVKQEVGYTEKIVSFRVKIDLNRLSSITFDIEVVVFYLKVT